MRTPSHLLWRVVRATSLIVGAVIALAAFWLISGMGFYFIDPVGDIPLGVLFYTMMAVVIFLTGRWVVRRI